jgi:hypothetical protein
MPANRWYDKINISALSDEARRLILERVKRKLGFTRALEALGISRGSLHNYLHGVRRVPDEVVYRALQHLEEGEFNEIVKGVDRLRAVGIIRGDGSIDYSLVLQAIALAARDEYLKQALLRFTVENFREDLRKMLGLSLAHVVFKWEPGFEEFLRERKKRRRVVSPGTIAEAERVLSQYLDPELYYYYYAVLAGAVSYAFDCYRVYYVHPLPMSEGGYENLSRINITLCVPRRILTPLVEPRILAPEPLVLVNTSVQDPCAGEVLNATTPLNIVTYAPTATLNLTLNTTTRDNITVAGYVEGEVWAAPVSEQPVEWCFYYEPVNKTICYVDVYRVYNITYTYILGYAVNGSLVADTFTRNLEYTVRDPSVLGELRGGRVFQGYRSTWKSLCHHLQVGLHRGLRERDTHSLHVAVLPRRGLGREVDQGS